MQPRFERALFAGGSVLEVSRARFIGGRSARAGHVSASVSCAEVALVLPSILDGVSSADEVVVRHVGSCLRCQCELARYRKLLRLLNQLRSYRVEPPPGAVTDVLGALGGGRAASRRPFCAHRAAARLRRCSRRACGSDHRSDRRAPGPPAEAPARGAIVMPTRGDSVLSHGRATTPARRAVAQLVEHRSPKPAVGGSSPSCPAHCSFEPRIVA